MRSLSTRLVRATFFVFAAWPFAVAAETRSCEAFFEARGLTERQIQDAFAGVPPHLPHQLARRAVVYVADMPLDQGARVRAWISLASAISARHDSWTFKTLPLRNAPGWIAFAGGGPAIFFSPEGDVFRAEIDPQEYWLEGAWNFNPRYLRRIPSSDEIRSRRAQGG